MRGEQKEEGKKPEDMEVRNNSNRKKKRLKKKKRTGIALKENNKN